MGHTSEFLCKSCGYSVMSSGGPDSGMMAFATTIVCETCRKIYDVTIATFDMDTGANRVEKEVRCPKSKKHAWKLWEFPGPCPKCGRKMKQEKTHILWD